MVIVSSKIITIPDDSTVTFEASGRHCYFAFLIDGLLCYFDGNTPVYCDNAIPEENNQYNTLEEINAVSATLGGELQPVMYLFYENNEAPRGGLIVNYSSGGEKLTTEIVSEKLNIDGTIVAVKADGDAKILFSTDGETWEEEIIGKYIKSMKVKAVLSVPSVGDKSYLQGIQIIYSSADKPLVPTTEVELVDNNHYKEALLFVDGTGNIRGYCSDSLKTYRKEFSAEDNQVELEAIPTDVRVYTSDGVIKHTIEGKTISFDSDLNGVVEYTIEQEDWKPMKILGGNVFAGSGKVKFTVDNEYVSKEFSAGIYYLPSVTIKENENIVYKNDVLTVNSDTTVEYAKTAVVHGYNVVEAIS